MGTHVAGHWFVRLLSESPERTNAFLENAQTSHIAGLPAATAKNPQKRPEEVPAAPGGSGGHPAQNHTNIPQSLLPRRHR